MTGKNRRTARPTLSGLAGLGVLLIALTACQTAPQVKDQASTHMRLGESLLQEGKSSQALGELLKAVDLDPDDPVIRNVLGVVYMEKGMLPQAIESFQKALELNPKYTQVYNNLGTAYLRSGKVQEAIAEFTKAVNDPLYGTPQFAYYNLGQSYMILKDYEKARVYFREAIKLSPQYSLAYHALGMAWKATGNPEEAAESLKKAIEYAPNYARGHYDLGEVLTELKEFSLARMAFQEVLKLAPGSELSQKAREKMKALP